jgi:hypothetical protein
MKSKKRRREAQKPAREGKPSSAVEETSNIEGKKGFRFDPYWDDEFAAYFDPTLRTCCQLKY